MIYIDQKDEEERKKKRMNEEDSWSWRSGVEWCGVTGVVCLKNVNYLSYYFHRRSNGIGIATFPNTENSSEILKEAQSHSVSLYHGCF